jgi:Mg2+ and Co2+ transporter CorA
MFLDKFCDIILEFADKRNKILNKISEQASEIADNMIKIAIFSSDQWKDELLNHLAECQRRKLIGRKQYPSKGVFFELLYKEYYIPEEPWYESQLAIDIVRNLKKYENSRDLYSSLTKEKLQKSDIDKIRVKIKSTMFLICKILSEKQIRDIYGFSNEITTVVDNYIKYWK